MKTIYDLKRRAKELAAVSETNAVDPARVGNLIDDTLELIDEYDKNVVSLGIRKTYATVATMEADKASPIGDDGKKLRFGQLVSVYDAGNTAAVDNGKVFAWQNPGWKLSSRVDAGYVRKEEIAATKETVESSISANNYLIPNGIQLEAGHFFLKPSEPIPFERQAIICQSANNQVVFFDKINKIFVSKDYNAAVLIPKEYVFCGYINPSAPESNSLNFIRKKIISNNDLLNERHAILGSTSIEISFAEDNDGFSVKFINAPGTLNKVLTNKISNSTQTLYSGTLSRKDSGIYFVMLTKGGGISLIEADSQSFIDLSTKSIVGFISSQYNQYSFPIDYTNLKVYKDLLLNKEKLSLNFNSVLDLNSVYLNKRCKVPAGYLWTGIKMICNTSGQVKVNSYRENAVFISSRTFTAVEGLNYFEITTSSVNSIDIYIAVEGVTSSVRTISPKLADNPDTYKLVGGKWVLNSYEFAYGIYVRDFKDISLNGRLSSIEKENSSSTKTIEELLSEKDHVVLEGKEYVLTKILNIPSGKRISGVRGRTIIRVPANIKTGLNLFNVQDVVLENLTITGDYNGTPLKTNNTQPTKPGIVDSVEDAYVWKGAGYNTNISSGGVTDEYIPQVGININTCEKVEILGCEIKNFSWAGIMNRLSGKNFRYAIKIENNYINNCYCGIKLYDEAERSQYIANNISLCQIGLFLDSGTNMFYGTGFNANRVGMLMGNGWNHAHGEFTDCPFTHCSLFGIIAKNIEHGQVFNGCKIGYVDSEDGNFGGICFLILNSRGLAWFNGKLINANTKFDGKFNLHGVSYNPTGKIDQFGNYNYVMTFEDVGASAANSNGGVNMMKNNTVTSGASFQITGGLDATNVILKDNYYISGESPDDINNA